MTLRGLAGPVMFSRSTLRTPRFLAALVFVAGLPACGDSAPSHVTAMPSVVQTLLLDPEMLKSVSRHSLEAGDRVPVLAESDQANAVKESDVLLRDTAVVSLDGAGVLHAIASGTSWVVWPGAQELDSTMVTVASEALPRQLEQPEWTPPAAPLKTVDVRYPAGRTRSVNADKSWKVANGADLQGALNSAQPGDEIVLASGATFTGNFVLPAKQGTGTDWIVVRAEAVAAAAGTRMTPELARPAAKVVTPNQDPAIRTAGGARRWRLVGFEIAHQTGAVLNYGIVVFGRGDEKSLAELPSDIVLDRMYVHGSPTGDNRRCIAFNGRSLAVIDSWLSECHSKGFDTQGVGGWGGPGPFLIENNRIEASGQGVMFGGADPQIADVSPSDIIIRRNYIYKPLEWGNGKWTVKAAFELKHGRRVLFEENVIENHWADAQTGYAILFQTLADDNRSWGWTTVQDVLVKNNIIRNSTSGANVLARVAYNGGTLPANPTSRIAFVNNLWQDVGRDPVQGTAGRVFQLLGDLRDLTIVNNSVTLAGTATQAIMFDGDPQQRTTVSNNIFPLTEYGIFGSGKGPGAPAIAFFAPGGVFTGNVIPGQSAVAYPDGNYFPADGAKLPGGSPDTACAAVKEWNVRANLPASAGAACDVLETLDRRVGKGAP